MGRIKLEGTKVREIIAFERSESGAPVPVVIFRQRKAEKKKPSKELRYPEQLIRSVMNAEKTMAEDYLERHERANKRRDGWLTQLGVNLYKASNRGRKKLRLFPRD